MRIRLPVGHRLFLAAATVAMLALLLPARLALGLVGMDRIGLSARAAEGSIWRGRLVEARLAGVPLGDLRIGLSPWPLFVGRARLDLAREGDLDPAAGAISVGRHALGIDDVTALVPLAGRLAPLPIAALDLADVSARFEDGVCTAAEGRVTARLAGDVAGLSLPGGLTGEARCDNGALLLPLASQTGMETLALRLLPGGRYRVDLAVRGDDPAVRDRLLAAGFAPGAGGYALGVDGTW